MCRRCNVITGRIYLGGIEMNVRELNRQQLDELKAHYICEVMKHPSYEDFANASNIADEEIYNHYEGICFVDDDFFCSCG